MKHTRPLLILMLLPLIGPLAQAQTAKVTKVVGRKAIVQVPEGETLHVGQILSGDGASSASSANGGGSTGKAPKGSRDHVLGFSARLFSTSTSSTVKGAKSTSTTALAVGGAYGWNVGKMEYGPQVSLAQSSTTGSTTSAYSVGGFFDYNIVPNLQGTELVYGAGAAADIGTSKTGGNSGTVMDLFAGGFVKYFPLGNTVAVRGDAGISYARTSQSAATYTDTGFGLKGALEVYF